MNCPKWFKYISCVIVYNSRKEILLGKRKEGQAEAGKWGLLGGVGAFGKSKSRWDFVVRELQYDIAIKLNHALFRFFRTVVLNHLAEFMDIEDYFCYYYAGDRPVRATKNLKAPEEVRWFSLEEIKQMNEGGEIAFNNYEIISEFISRIN